MRGYSSSNFPPLVPHRGLSFNARGHPLLMVRQLHCKLKRQVKRGAHSRAGLPLPTDVVSYDIKAGRYRSYCLPFYKQWHKLTRLRLVCSVAAGLPLAWCNTNSTLCYSGSIDVLLMYFDDVLMYVCKLILAWVCVGKGIDLLACLDMSFSK